MTTYPNLYSKRQERYNDKERSVLDYFLHQEIQKRPWYHSINISDTIKTPGFEWSYIWDTIRRVRESIDYSNKSVLDLGSWDGMWAFEAEALRASFVVATDCMNYWQLPWQQGMNNLLLLREALFSKVVPLWNVSPMGLESHLKNVLYSHKTVKGGFDIVHHLGLLYHQRDPMFSLAQVRSVIKPNGMLLLETAVHNSDTESKLYYNKGGNTIYDDFTTWFAPTIPCLRDMLHDSFFEVVVEQSAPVLDKSRPYSRYVVLAKAVEPSGSIKNKYILDPSYGHGFSSHLLNGLPEPAPGTEESPEVYFEKRFPGHMRKGNQT